jgi:hypothetical protein
MNMIICPDYIHRVVFISKHNVSELDLFPSSGIKNGGQEGFLLILDPVIETSSFKGAQLSRDLPSFYTWRRKHIQFPRRCVRGKKNTTMDNVQNNNNHVYQVFVSKIGNRKVISYKSKFQMQLQFNQFSAATTEKCFFWVERCERMTRYPRFRYPRFYFSIWASISYPQLNLKPVTWVEPSPGLSGNVMQMISLA